MRFLESCPSLACFILSSISVGLFSAAAEIDGFKASEGWERVLGARAVEGETRIEVERGEGGTILYNGDDWKQSGFLITERLYRDSVVSMEFMIPQGSNAGVYLQSRYEVQIFDSFGSDTLGHGDLGGIYERWDESRPDGDKGFEGQAPRVNAAKAPGEWQTLEVKFRAPRYNDAEFKVDDALFLEVTINGEIVQKDTTVSGPTREAVHDWERARARLAIQGDHGPIAIRNLQIDNADFEAVRILEESGETNSDELVDLVEIGRDTFKNFGCIECHATKSDDMSVKTGPNLWGLFQRIARQREVVETGGDRRFSVSADRNYLHRSMRSPNVELAIAESGEKTGAPYLPIMAPFSPERITDFQTDAIWRYLGTLNNPEERGPVIVLEPKGGSGKYDPHEDPMQVFATDRTRIHRGTMKGQSGRAIHVGQVDGLNYSFDPRTLSIEKVWQGGFIDGSSEWSGRGGNAFQMGYDSREIDLGAAGFLISPVDVAGERIDFSFKEAVFQDWDTISSSLENERDHLELLAEVGARFLGYSIDSTKADDAPWFAFQVGDNRISIRLEVASDGEVAIAVRGSLSSDQSFIANVDVLNGASVDVGSLDRNGRWTIPASESVEAKLTAKIAIGSLVWRPAEKAVDYLTQPLVVEESSASLPEGYRIENYLSPTDNYGRDTRIEALGAAVAPDGTIVIASRKSGIWRIANGEWHLFAEGTFDSLGLVVEDDKGLQVVVSQKPELTRISDKNGDGIADTYETLSDQFSYHGNYHSYMHGPIRDAGGNYYFNLNLLHTDSAVYKAKGLYMGTSGGFSGWTIKITPEGDFVPWANGLRSPAGFGMSPSGRIWYADNQGEFVGTSKLFALNEGGFFGHPSALVDLPGMGPESEEIQWEAVASRREKAAVLFPHNIVANSVGNPAWDVTEGKFGPFAGQMFIGDQTQSKLFRVTSEVVDGVEQGCVIPFAEGFGAGIMRPVFLPDGSLLLGQTGRGWQARGGNVSSLQRVVWDGQTIAQAIYDVSDVSIGFELEMTREIEATIDASSIKVRSWTYRDAPDYGSPEMDLHDETITSVSRGEDGKTISIALEKPDRDRVHPEQIGRVYRITVERGAGEPPLLAYYTKNR